MADLPLMPKATAVWLVDNTTLTFEQIAAFTGMHILEIEGIADGDVAQGIKGIDPIVTGQINRDNLKRAESDPKVALRLLRKAAAIAPEPKRRGPRYTPLSKRQDRPAAIAWLVRYHPELPDSAIVKLVGTTKTTIAAVRDRTHWNSSNIRPVDPVALGLCKQTELDESVRKAAAKKVREAGDDAQLSDEEKMRLMTTAESLSADTGEMRLPSSMQGLENFSLSDPRENDERSKERPVDAESFFNLPAGSNDEEDEENDEGGDPRS